MAGIEREASLSASTETLSDLDEKTISEVSQRRNSRYTETFGSDGVGSGSESNLDIDEDSEATVSDDLTLQGSESETLDAANWQPSSRLTARQQARQQRLLQGIQQTQWNDMSLPRGLDFSGKNKPKGHLSEEQHLKRMKDAEARRQRAQKARRDVMESTKARIRAATSNKFKDIVGNGHVERNKIAKRTIGFLPGRLRIRHGVQKTVIILPEGAELPCLFRRTGSLQYPPKKVRMEFQMKEDCEREKLKLGSQLKLVTEKENRIGLFSEGRRVGSVLNLESRLPGSCGTLIGLKHNKTAKHGCKIILKFTS